mmetsp:Transcript_25097/g.68195  ORF Transcript_25097/g.68195 Transcript_25097/m.68195 type:complete len:241 (-) Transcript_25097:1048-1770(-)
MQHWGKDVPGLLQLIIADEQALIAVHHIQQEALIRIWQLLGVCVVVHQVQLGGIQAHAQARDLVVDLEVDGLPRLNADHKLVGGHVDVGAHFVLENVAGHMPELHTDLSAARVQRLASLEQEWHTIPACIVDVQRNGSKGGAQGALGHCCIIQVARQISTTGTASARPAAVLAQCDILQRHLRHRLQDLDLLITDGLSIQGHRWLHGEQCHNLEQVVLHDIADDAVPVEVASAAFSAKVF